MPDELSAKDLIDHAFLVAAPPHSVYEWLGENAPDNPHVEAIPGELVQALRGRNEPLINLGLAQWTTNREVLKGLFVDGELALRCAVLSNPQLGGVFWGLSGIDLFTEDEHRDFALQSDPRLLEAYLGNPSLPPDVLNCLFEKTGPFKDIDESRWTEALLFAAKNPILHHEYESPAYASSWDGFSGATHGAPVIAAWRLLDTLPATQHWAAVLYQLLFHMYYNLCPRDYDEEEVFSASETEAEGVDSMISRFQAAYEPVERKFFKDVFEKWRTEGDEDEVWDDFGELRTVVASKAPSHVGDHEKP